MIVLVMMGLSTYLLADIPHILNNDNDSHGEDNNNNDGVE